MEEKVYIQGRKIKFDAPPVIKDNRTLIPVRAITEGLGATVDWDSATKTVTISRDDTVIELTLGSYEVIVNGEVYTLDVPAQLKSNRTFVPLRFVSQILNEQVDYNEDTGEIDIGLGDGESIKFIEALDFENLIEEGIATKIAKVDGEEKLLVTVGRGEKRTGGYSIDIISVEKVDQEIYVYAETSDPAKGASVPQVITYPTDAVLIDTKYKNYDFKYELIAVDPDKK